MNKILQTITYIMYYILLMMIFLTLLVQAYIYLQPKKEYFLGNTNNSQDINKVQCDNLKRKYPDIPNLSCSVGSQNKELPLKNFYVKTAYNCIALKLYNWKVRCLCDY